jgi:glycosyltransferase involved in cell wall biosynthesis
MKVSVIIPTYNRSELLLEAVKSVLNQTYQDFEIIVIDDGSNDDTEDVINGFSDKLQYIKQENAGVNAARNRALDLAQGEYIATLDNDDIWLDYKLGLQVEILDKFKSIGFSYSNFYILKPEDARIPDGLSSWHKTPIDRQSLFDQTYNLQDLTLKSPIPDESVETFKVHIGDIYHASLFEPQVLPSTAIFRRSLLPDNIRFIEHDSLCGDWDFFARLSKEHKTAYINLETTLNRSHEDAIRLTRTDRTIQLTKRAELIKRVWKSDTQFYKENKTEVDQTLNKTLLNLSYLHVLNGRTNEASSAYQEITLPHSGLSKKQILIANLGMKVPGGSHLLELARSVKHKLNS